jgi:OHCU decarboxylase
MMSDRRPFSSLDELRAAADTLWGRLDRADWLEAFSAHPRIGEVPTPDADPTRNWSSAEQSGMKAASEDVRARLIDANRAYERRFGYIFIICATGRPAAGMLAALEERLANRPEVELPIAAEQQRLITRVRLDKLLEGGQ